MLRSSSADSMTIPVDSEATVDRGAGDFFAGLDFRSSAVDFPGMSSSCVVRNSSDDFMTISVDSEAIVDRGAGDFFVDLDF